MATPVFVGNTDWQIISWRSDTDPRTAVTTLVARWRGPYTTYSTQWTTLTPGTACTVTGFTALTQVGYPEIDRRTGVYVEMSVVYEGFHSGTETESLITPTRSFREEPRSFSTEYEGIKLNVHYLAVTCETTWSSTALQTNPKYATNISSKDDPAPISGSSVHDDPFPDISLLVENTHYEVDTIDGWVDQTEDVNGIWQNVEFATKILKEP